MGWLTRPVDKRPQVRKVKDGKTTTVQRHQRGRGVTTTTHDSNSGVTRQRTRYSWLDLFGR